MTPAAGSAQGAMDGLTVVDFSTGLGEHNAAVLAGGPILEER